MFIDAVQQLMKVNLSIVTVDVTGNQTYDGDCILLDFLFWKNIINAFTYLILFQYNIKMDTENYYPLVLYERNNIHTLPDFNQYYPNGCGLCNQLFSFVTGILKCTYNNKKYVIIDSFSCDALVGNICNVNKIINLTATAENLNQLLPEIKLFDRTQDYLTHTMFANKHSDFGWYSWFNKQLFDNILTKIKFTDGFYQIVDIIKKNFNNINDLTFIHFRVEEDAIDHWSKQNGLSREEFRNKLLLKYEYLINKYVDPQNVCYILSYDESVVVNMYPQFKFIYTPYNVKVDLLMKYYGMSGRELCAIIDLLMGLQCSKLFIGCHNMKLGRGSSFSYVIANNIKCKCVLIDLDNVDSVEEVYENQH